LADIPYGLGTRISLKRTWLADIANLFQQIHVYPIYNMPEVVIMTQFHTRNIYLDEMEETEERSIVQGKLDYFLTNRTLQVPSIN